MFHMGELDESRLTTAGKLIVPGLIDIWATQPSEPHTPEIKGEIGYNPFIVQRSRLNE